jgi:hypothetical protein
MDLMKTTIRELGAALQKGRNKRKTAKLKVHMELMMNTVGEHEVQMELMMNTFGEFSTSQGAGG